MANTYERIIEIMKEEIDSELHCAEMAKLMYESTRNPIRRRRLKRSINNFMQHIVGIKIVMHTIEREMLKEEES